MIKLDILSDPICPWCYIGKAGLDRALEARPDHPFSVEWHPFQLNPEMPREGIDRRAYLEAKFGGKENAVAVYARIAEAAEAAGLALNLEAIERTPNTIDAHRLIHWAAVEGRQTAAVSRLFRAYFEAGCDIGEKGVLLDIAEGIGLERDVIARLLESDADIAEIRARETHARKRGVTGVPTFVVANRHVRPGAQPTELWTQTLDEIDARIRAAE